MTFTLRGEVGGGVLKMGIIINKRYFVFFWTTAHTIVQ